MSLGESLDTTTAAGRLMLNLLDSVSQWERKAIAECTAMALRHMGDTGKAHNHTPLGFRREGDALIEDETEIQTARRVVQLKREGFSMSKIATIFNEENIYPKDVGRWHASTVKRILDRFEVYFTKSRCHDSISGLFIAAFTNLDFHDSHHALRRSNFVDDLLL